MANHDSFTTSQLIQLSIPEIAAQLQVSEQTVKNQLTTALNHLRKSLVIPSAFLIAGAVWRLSII